jgi:hypothetical protein
LLRPTEPASTCSALLDWYSIPLGSIPENKEAGNWSSIIEVWPYLIQVAHWTVGGLDKSGQSGTVKQPIAPKSGTSSGLLVLSAVHHFHGLKGTLDHAKDILQAFFSNRGTGAGRYPAATRSVSPTCIRLCRGALRPPGLMPLFNWLVIQSSYAGLPAPK